jgi:transcriptional regulator with XRE-family HTH domain
MKKQRITQVEMAEMLDVSQATVSRWLSQEVYPDWYNLVKIHESTTGLVTADDFYEQFVFYEIEGGHEQEK